MIAIVKLEWGDGIKIEINMIFFTVIITTYNRANLVATAVKSVIHQTFQDFELIIVDDASTDGTEKIIKQFEDSRIRYFKNESNLHKSYIFVMITKLELMLMTSLRKDLLYISY